VPFLAIALLMDRMGKSMRRLTKVSHWVSIAAGCLLVIFGVLFATNQLSILSRWLPGWEIGI
jgi:cytochrome c biogenesis protein CcdA